MKRLAFLLAGVALAATLAGCHTAEGDANAEATVHVNHGATAPQKAVTQLPFKETEKAGAMNVTLQIEKAEDGGHLLTAVVDNQSVTAAEAQVIMASMGHGAVVDLKQTAPGKWETATDAMVMGGDWLIRIKTTDSSQAENSALFRVDFGS